MATVEEKPLISILMAVYEPRLDWLREQLESLNAQTYPNLRLYVRDDCSPTVPFSDIRACVEDCVRAFPWTAVRNEKNLGSNGTFQLLTEEAEGDYFAYCDQDDVWLPEKLEQSERRLRETGAGLVCSDVLPVDSLGRPLGKSIQDLRPRHVFAEGVHLTGVLLYRNFVIGCTMLIRREIAVAALPFAASMVHDHYLAFACAVCHAIAVCPGHPVNYRQHRDNQTGVLARITTKQDYIEKHMRPFCLRAAELRQRFPEAVPEDALRWARAREANAARKPGGLRQLWALRNQNFTTTVFEVAALRLPAPLFRLAVKAIQSGKL